MLFLPSTFQPWPDPEGSEGHLTTETQERLRGTIYGLENAGGAELSVPEVTLFMTGSSGLSFSSECLHLYHGETVTHYSLHGIVRIQEKEFLRRL